MKGVSRLPNLVKIFSPIILEKVMPFIYYGFRDI